MDEPTIASIQLQAGEKLFGRYVLERKLGQGGMGVVWLAQDTLLRRLAALKFLPEVVRQDRMAVDDLRDETRRCLELTHPNIVRIYDFEEDAQAAGISMEFVDGGSLSAQRAERPQRIFETDDLLPWLRDLCAALQHAHTEARVVHRDLKPANLLVNSRGQLKVTDFGIARTITDSVTRVTGHEPTSGTLLYMSPQQFLGKASAPSDDIYSVGATLYELLTGKPPFFTGSVAAQLHAATAPSVEERRREFNKTGNPIPEVWEEVIAACLEKDPAQRPATVQEIYDRIASSSSTKKASAVPVVEIPPPMPVPEVPSATQAIPISTPSNGNGSGAKWVAIVALLVVLMIGGGAAGWYFKRPHRRLTPRVAPVVPVPPVAPAAAKKGMLVVNSAPSGASVLLNEELVGTTPLSRADLAPGTHRVRLVLDGYEPQELVAVIAAGETRDTGMIPLKAKAAPPEPPGPSIVINRPRVLPNRPVPPAPGEYVWLFPDSSERRLTRAELSGLSKDELWRARNEIYARHGFIFASPRGRLFARSLGPNYKPVSGSDAQTFQRMNAIEQANVELIKSLE